MSIVPNECPSIHPPAPGFCYDGNIKPRKDENGCTIGYDCEPGCPEDCGPGRSCQYCWGVFACIPSGAIC